MSEIKYSVLEQEICELIEKSLLNRKYKEFVKFPLSEKTVNIVWKKVKIDLSAYYCVIHSDEIRHIQKEHPDDVHHICKIPYHLEKIAKIERTFSLNRKTNKREPCILFNKFIEKGKLVIIKLNISREKVLRLKTLYEDV